MGAACRIRAHFAFTFARAGRAPALAIDQGRPSPRARTVVARSACVKLGHVDNLPPEMERVSRAELQAAILRFEGTLNARLTQAFEPLVASVRGEVRLRAMRDHLVYVASALDIATAPVPEANLLDMVAFVELAKGTCRTRWNVDLHGEHGAAVLAALDAASTDVWRVARALLSPEKEEELRRLVREWHDENPGLTEIAAVRLPAFSAVAGRGETRAEVAAHGIFSYVKKGVTEADMARLLGERALFLALRMPFLVRLQARLAAHEVTHEVVHELPDRLAQTVTAVAERAGPLMRRAIGAGAIATAGLVTAGALAYAAVRRQGRPT